MNFFSDFKLHVLLKEDIKRRFRKKKLISPCCFFLIGPIVILLITLLSTGYFDVLFYPIDDITRYIEMSVSVISSWHLIGIYFIFGSIIWPIYTIIEAGTAISPIVKNGTIKMIISKPISRVEFILSKFLEGGQTSKNLVSGLKERFRIMKKNYGLAKTLAKHIVLAIRLLIYYFR